MLTGVDALMPIGEFSDRSGLSPKRLRSYAAAGLLVPAAVDSGSGYRYYSPGQLREAQLIDALRDAGMPLAEIASLIRDPSSRQLDVWARQVEAEAAQRQTALQLVRRLLAVDADATHMTAPEHSGDDVRTTLETAARTDTGRVRENNEDALLCLDRIVAVADGMGGLPGGEIASSLAVALLEAACTGRSLEELEAVVRAANRAISERASAAQGLEGMGTTLCALALTDAGTLAVVNVGDSRAYLIRDGSLRQLTEDHSVTAELVRRGELTEQEALDHPHRNVLTRVLGGGPTVEVDGAVQSVLPGDRLLLCTDGLFNEVSDEEILSLVDATDDLSAAVDALVDRAVSEGGHDNVTVVVAEVSRSDPPVDTSRAGRRAQRPFST
jgi:PPM family protein phosphatase